MILPRLILLNQNLKDLGLDKEKITELESSVLVPSLCVILAVVIVSGIAAAARKYRDY